jgi:hypothetical protein
MATGNLYGAPFPASCRNAYSYHCCTPLPCLNPQRLSTPHYRRCHRQTWDHECHGPTKRRSHFSRHQANGPPSSNKDGRIIQKSNDDTRIFFLMELGFSIDFRASRRTADLVLQRYYLEPPGPNWSSPHFFL